MDYLKELIEYGFSEKEAKVYLSLLMIGNSTVYEISEKADLVRTTTYDILKSLREGGFVSSYYKNKVLFFEACHPSFLAKDLAIKKGKIEKIIPNLSKLKEEMIKFPKVELYEGEEGMKKVFLEILKPKTELIAFSNNKAMVEKMPFFAPNFIKMRANSNIPLRIISEPSETTQKLLVDKDKKEKRKTRKWDKMNKFLLNMYVFGDSVAILGSSFKDPFGIVIHNKDFAGLQKSLFEEVWKKSQ